MLLLLQHFHNLRWEVLQMLLMEPLVAMSMLKGREAGSTGCEQSERPHFHGVKERLESEQKKKKSQNE